MEINAPTHSVITKPVSGFYSAAPRGDTTSLALPNRINVSAITGEAWHDVGRLLPRRLLRDASFTESIRELLSDPVSQRALLDELKIPAPCSVEELEIVPRRFIGAGHTRAGIAITVTARLAHGAHQSGEFVLKIEHASLRRHCFFASSDESSYRGVNQLLNTTPHAAHFVRTLAGKVSSAGHAISLETYAHGTPLRTVFRDNLPVGVAAAAKALSVMCDVWFQCKVDEKRGVLFDSSLDDIVVAGTNTKSVFPCFVDFHEGRYVGNEHALMLGVARLLAGSLFQTPYHAERTLLESLSVDLLEEKLFTPLRPHMKSISPEELFGIMYDYQLSDDGLEELGNPWWLELKKRA